MYGIRVTNTNYWMLSIPGRYKVIEHAGSTWTKPPTIDARYWCYDLIEVLKTAYNIQDETTLHTMFCDNPSKYLETIKVKFAV